MSNKLSVIIPAYNEAAGIGQTLSELQPVAGRLQAEVILVDDGSTDATSRIASGFPWVKLVRHPYNKGYGAAIKTGVRAAQSADVVALFDADGQHRPEDLENLFTKFDNYDLLVGRRGADSHHDFLRRPGKKVLQIYANFLTGRKIPDLNSGLRLMRHKVIFRLLHLMPDGFSFSTTSTIAFMNLGYNTQYEPIVVRKRTGNSTVRQVKHGVGTLILILRLTVLFNSLKVFLPASAFFIAVGLLYEVIYGNVFSLHAIKMLPGALFLLLTGIIIFFFGLVVDQLAELRKHPLGK